MLTDNLDHAEGAEEIPTARVDRHEPLSPQQKAIVRLDPPGEIALMEPSLDTPTDTDQSMMIAAAHRHELMFVDGIGWLHWKGTHWEADPLAAQELAKIAARKRLLRTVETGRREEVGQAMRLENSSHIKGALEEAQSDPRLLRRLRDLDRDPWSFNCLNGTLDLRTGQLKPHDPGDLLTKLAPVAYLPDARHEALERILRSLGTEIPELPGFLQRLFGMCLTADASAEILILIQGDGGAGKTTLSEAFLNMIGDYGVRLPFETLCLQQRGRQAGAAQPDVVRLRGARFACASEGDETARLDAGMVKSLTGNEMVVARGLHKSPIEFSQTWKLSLVTNFEPNCSGDDSGLWRRLVAIRFPTVPPQDRDPELKRLLTTDPAARSALLAWAVQGCRAWFEAGGGRRALEIPAAIDGLTAAYRQRQDTLSQWWSDTLNLSVWMERDGCVPVADLRRMYIAWSESQGTTPLGSRRYNAFLARQGLVQTTARIHGTPVKAWKGISLNAPVPPAESPAESATGRP